MSHRSRMLDFARIAALLGIPLTATSAPAPGTSDIAHCSAIAAPDARLACYDNLAGRPADATSPAAAASVPAPRGPATALSPASVTAAKAPTVPVVPAPESEADAARNFGLTQAQAHATPKGLQAIHARIANFASNQFGHAYLVLDNGQTWTLTDEDGRISAGDAITIRRASLGSFIMTTQSNHTYHVHRTQ